MSKLWPHWWAGRAPLCPHGPAWHRKRARQDATNTQLPIHQRSDPSSIVHRPLSPQGQRSEADLNHKGRSPCPQAAAEALAFAKSEAALNP